MPAEGVTVTVRVKNNSLYPNSPSATGSKVYSGVTDASGNYTISVVTNGNGVTGYIEVADQSGTRDTIINGATVTGPACNFNGTSTNRTLYSGVNEVYNYNMSASILVGNPGNLNIGTAIVTGTIQINHFEEDTTGGGSYFYTLKSYPMKNHDVYLDFNRDPNTQLWKTYNTTTDSNGVYSITITTTDASGFSNTGYLRINDYAGTRDTVRLNGTVTPGQAGVFDNKTRTIFNIDPTEIKNHEDLTYSTFN